MKQRRRGQRAQMLLNWVGLLLGLLLWAHGERPLALFCGVVHGLGLWAGAVEENAVSNREGVDS